MSLTHLHTSSQASSQTAQTAQTCSPPISNSHKQPSESLKAETLQIETLQAETLQADIRQTVTPQALTPTGVDFPLPNGRRVLRVAIASALLLALPSPASWAHNMVTDADIGATFHLEPDHNPVAGKASQVWFALTREGGEPIPLADCECKLEVFEKKNDQNAIATPELTAIDVEEYSQIPSSEITFPQAGIYEVVLSGAPSDTAATQFSEFRLAYEVTVKPATGGGTTATQAKAKADADRVAAEQKKARQEAARNQPTIVDSVPWLISSLSLLGLGMFLGVFAVGRSLWQRGRGGKSTVATLAATAPAPLYPVQPERSSTPTPAIVEPSEQPEDQPGAQANNNQPDQPEDQPGAQANNDQPTTSSNLVTPDSQNSNTDSATKDLDTEKPSTETNSATIDASSKSTDSAATDSSTESAATDSVTKDPSTETNSATA